MFGPDDRHDSREQHIHVHTHVHQHQEPSGAVTDLLCQILDGIRQLQEQGVEIMVNVTLAREALTALNTVTNTLAEAVQTVIVADAAEDAAFQAEIDRLKQLIVDGEAVTQADLDGLTAGMGGTKATLEAVAAALSAMGTSPTEPIPVPEIPPVEPPVEQPPAPPVEPEIPPTEEPPAPGLSNSRRGR